MTTDAAIIQNYERDLIRILQELPLKQIEQLVNFARFLQSQLRTDKLVDEETIEEIEADNARWDATLATDASQSLLSKMASEARAEHRAGKTRPMAFRSDGRIIPG